MTSDAAFLVVVQRAEPGRESGQPYHSLRSDCCTRHNNSPSINVHQADGRGTGAGPPRPRGGGGLRTGAPGSSLATVPTVRPWPGRSRRGRRGVGEHARQVGDAGVGQGKNTVGGTAPGCRTPRPGSAAPDRRRRLGVPAGRGLGHVRPIDTGSRTATRAGRSRPASANSSRTTLACSATRSDVGGGDRTSSATPASQPAGRGPAAPGRPPRRPRWAGAGVPEAAAEPVVPRRGRRRARFSSSRSTGSPSSAATGRPPATIAPSLALATTGTCQQPAKGVRGTQGHQGVRGPWWRPRGALSSIQTAPIRRGRTSAPPRSASPPGPGRRARPDPHQTSGGASVGWKAAMVRL